MLAHFIKAVVLRVVLVLLSVLSLFVVIEIGVRLLHGRFTASPRLDRSETLYYAEARQRTVWAREKTDALRVAVVGDSFTQGAGVQRYDCYAERLEWLPNVN